MATPRGLKNNNPGNLIKGKKPFLGEIFPSADARFRQFESPEYGYRASMKQLITFISRGENSIEKIIPHWAPPSDKGNNTPIYIKKVEQFTGISRIKALSVDDADSIKKIMAAISYVENGKVPDTSVIDKAFLMIPDKKKS